MSGPQFTAAAIAVTLIGLLILALNARRSARRGSDVGAALFFVGLALSPLWVSLILVLVGGALDGNPREFWGIAGPWIVMGLYFKYSAYAFGLAIILAVAYFATRGNATRKFYVTLVCLAVVVLLSVVAQQVQQRYAAAVQEDRAAREAAVAAFVQQSTELTTLIQGPVTIKATLASVTERERYWVRVRSPDNSSDIMQAMVEVTRPDDRAQFRVMCMTPDLEAWRGWYQPGFTCPLGAVGPAQRR